jgi:hypothetical protein
MLQRTNYRGSNMMNKIEQLADNLKAESRQFADRAIKGMRTAGLETAGLLTGPRSPCTPSRTPA